MAVLIERVLDAFVEDLFSVVWSIGTFRARNGVREAEFVQKGWKVVRVIFDVELVVEEVLYLLILPGLSVTQTVEELLLLGFVELP